MFIDPCLFLLEVVDRYGLSLIVPQAAELNIKKIKRTCTCNQVGFRMPLYFSDFYSSIFPNQHMSPTLHV